MRVLFVKLGGSLITDKHRAYTAHPEVIARLAGEVKEAQAADPALKLLIGHGSGSFGHWAAEPYGTRQGVQTAREWRGYAQVAAAAARLNHIVTDAFLTAGVPVLSVQPSASARCRAGALHHLDAHPITQALAHGLTPLIYGDVALDDVWGGTIVSTEDLFVHLVDVLTPAHILLLGEVEGVLDAGGRVIDRITLAQLPTLRRLLGGSEGVDVTGGMADKVERMAGVVGRHPQTEVHIFSGRAAGSLRRALLDPGAGHGTCICAAAGESTIDTQA
jgi:isopentenyl phosphate kinase